MQPPGATAWVPALVVEQAVELGGGQGGGAVRGRHQVAEADEVRAAALGARTVACREGERLVEEEQRRVVLRVPLPDASAPELECARDPGATDVVTPDVPGAGAVVQAAPVARPGPSPRGGDDLAEGVDPIARRGGHGAHATTRAASAQPAVLVVMAPRYVGG